MLVTGERFRRGLLLIPVQEVLVPLVEVALSEESWCLVVL